MFKENKFGRRTRALLHRSPAISSTGEQRLALVIDTPHGDKSATRTGASQHELELKCLAKLLCTASAASTNEGMSMPD